MVHVGAGTYVIMADLVGSTDKVPLSKANRACPHGLDGLARHMALCRQS
jgi:hypothetical protein